MPKLWWDRVSLFNASGCTGTYSIDQTGLKLIELPVAASWVLELKGLVPPLPGDELHSYTSQLPWNISFTIPLVELGGKWSINCFNMEYNTNIVFQIKFVYKDKKHRMTQIGFLLITRRHFAQLKRSGVIQCMQYMWWGNIIFVGTMKLPVIKKEVRMLEEKNRYESYYLWNDVTFRLKIRDINTDIKTNHKLKGRQREKLKEGRRRRSRGQKTIPWQHKVLML